MLSNRVRREAVEKAVEIWKVARSLHGYHWLVNLPGESADATGNTPELNRF
jgi:hypothetical protein